MSRFLWRNTIMALFHSVGKISFSRRRLNKSNIHFNKPPSYIASITTPSSPRALLCFIYPNDFLISSGLVSGKSYDPFCTDTVVCCVLEVPCVQFSVEIFCCSHQIFSTSSCDLLVVFSLKIFSHLVVFSATFSYFCSFLFYLIFSVLNFLTSCFISVDMLLFSSFRSSEFLFFLF